MARITRVLPFAASALLVVALSLAPAGADQATVNDAKEDGEVAGLAAKSGEFSYSKKAAGVVIDFSYLAPDAAFQHSLFIRAGERLWISYFDSSGWSYFSYAKPNSAAEPKPCAVENAATPATEDQIAQVTMRVPAKCFRTKERGAPVKVTFCYQILNESETQTLYESVPGGNSVAGETSDCETKPIRR